MSGTTPSLRLTILDGIRLTFGFSLGAFMFGVIYGAAAHVRGLPDAVILGKSLLAFAGAAQFAALPLWDEPLPLAAIAISTIMISTRNILMGVTLAPMLRRAPVVARYVGIGVIADASWALVMQDRGRPHLFAFYLASSLLLFGMWNSGVAIGIALPGLLDPITLAAIGYGGVVFLSLILVMLARSRICPTLPWLVAAAVAVVSDMVLPPHLVVLAGVGAGAVTTFIVPDRAND